MKDILYITLKVQAAQNVSTHNDLKNGIFIYLLFLQLMVQLKPEQPDRFRQPCCEGQNHDIPRAEWIAQEEAPFLPASLRDSWRLGGRVKDKVEGC